MTIPQLSDKVVMILLQESDDSCAILVDVEFCELGDRLFVVGTVPNGILPGYAGKTFYLAWSRVEQFYVFDSVEEMLHARDQYSNSKQKSRFFSWR